MTKAIFASVYWMDIFENWIIFNISNEQYYYFTLIRQPRISAKFHNNICMKTSNQSISTSQTHWCPCVCATNIGKFAFNQHSRRLGCERCFFSLVHCVSECVSNPNMLSLLTSAYSSFSIWFVLMAWFENWFPTKCDKSVDLANDIHKLFVAFFFLPADQVAAVISGANLFSLFTSPL